MLAYGARDTAANVTPLAFSSARSLSVNVRSAAIVHVDQPDLAIGALEDVLLLDLHHRQPPPLCIDGVTQVSDLAFARQQLRAGFQPFLTGGDIGIGGGSCGHWHLLTIRPRKYGLRGAPKVIGVTPPG